ncbi:MAG TPA: ABC transporter ATP-binding protein [Planctomycetota bacterium]|nr:ABC transporter ATP-binding protein [Planctomycetota bacterium]HRR80676.1 ABC transporter ATP-binding protein [Planctomycetota bacterium]HRT93264.1 ABC transporter ATP-binding protein [Planctomycetota bacterium]
MPEPVIRVEGLSKSYRIGARESYHTFREAITDALAAPFRRLRNLGRAPSGGDDTIWALKDVSFEVQQGEVLGIIGRNGAGKSTLLKILSRITEPTEGRARIRGRVASLLEVGTGFHPELTGRENIYLNGAILGMSRAEIARKFDEIVAFAELDKFIDTPVKRYSSGMYVRLAFAVAAHLEPEILLVDEVLAVGDAGFQQKCLGKMSEVAHGGRTVLFVSHNMAAIAHLCRRALVLDAGSLVADLDPGAAVRLYLRTLGESSGASVCLRTRTEESGDGSARILEGSIRDREGNPKVNFSLGESIVFEFAVRYLSPSQHYSHGILIVNSDGTPVYHLWDVDSRSSALHPARQRVVRACIPQLQLVPDRYRVSFWVGDTIGNRADLADGCLSFTVDQSNPRVRRPLLKAKGVVFQLADWSYRDVDTHLAGDIAQP